MLHCLSRLLTLSLVMLASTFATASASELMSFQLSFYSENISLQYNTSMVFPAAISTEESELVKYFQRLEKTEYTPLLNDLKRYKKELALNDWLYYRLMEKAVENIFHGKSQVQQTLICWFLLSKSGYETRMTYLKDEVFLYVYCTDALFEVPMIEDEGKTFINLSTIRQQDRNRQVLYVLNFVPVSANKAFSFDLSQLPKLQPQYVSKELAFGYENQVYKLNVQLDLTIPQIMSDYPFFDEMRYLETPLSETVAESLLPQLRHFLQGKSQREGLEMLVSFTRSFPYKEDKEYFGRSKPMIADEVFHYRYSDCEDRSALFYQLVRDLLDLPMAIIAFPDHLTVGVELPEAVGSAILYNNRKYTICDPTGPAGSSAIGFLPKNYENQSFKIIGTYK